MSNRDHETHRAVARRDLSVRALETIRPIAACSGGRGEWMHLLEATARVATTPVTVHKPTASKEPSMNVQAFTHRAPSIKYQPRSTRLQLRRGAWLCLWGADTGGAYCLLEASLTPGMEVPRHTHTREDETYYVLSGELEVVVGDETFVLGAGDTLMAPRNVPHQLRNSGNVDNHYLLVFSPSGFDEFLRVTAVYAPDQAVASTGSPPVAAPDVRDVAADYGIRFG